MRSFTILAFAASTVSAFPNLGPNFALEAAQKLEAKRDFGGSTRPGCTVSALCDAVIDVSDEQAHIPTTVNEAVKISRARNNCGFLHAAGCKTFDAEEQYVSTTGDHAWQSPAATDIRGPCPGLNAAANHGYLPRNGIANTQQTIDGLYAAYGMGADLAGFLAIYSIAFDGDLLTGEWSIGGPFNTGLGDLLTQPQGDGYSHNNYEGDTSITRCDAFINGGDAHSSSMTRWQYAWDSAQPSDDYTFDTMHRLFAKNTHRSIQTNPYYFAPLFSTTLVAPAAHNFIVAMMSNHTAENPSGYLNGDIFQTFWGVGGTSGNFKWLPGQERIPDNWYKRPSSDPYDIPDVFGDLLPAFLAYPDTFRFGGNMAGVNTYAGIDITNLTGGLFNFANLFEGNNLACFLFETEQQAIPQQLNGLVNDVAKAVSTLTGLLGPLSSKFQCPQLGVYNEDLLTPYTGRTYKPDAPRTGPKNC